MNGNPIYFLTQSGVEHLLKNKNKYVFWLSDSLSPQVDPEVQKSLLQFLRQEMIAAFGRETIHNYQRGSLIDNEIDEFEGVENILAVWDDARMMIS